MILLFVVVVIPALIGAGLWIWQERSNAQELDRIAHRLRRQQLNERERQHQEVSGRLLGEAVSEWGEDDDASR